MIRIGNASWGLRDASGFGPPSALTVWFRTWIGCTLTCLRRRWGSSCDLDAILSSKRIPMKYLITGGAGFIGSHLAEELLQRGDEVCVIDDLSTGGMENIQHLKGGKGLRYIIDSVLNRPLMAELVDEADVVFHLAAAVGVRLIVESPGQKIGTNLRATGIVL